MSVFFVTAYLGEPHGSAKSARDFARALLAVDDDVRIVSPLIEDFGTLAAGFDLSSPVWCQYPPCAVRHRNWRGWWADFRNGVRRLGIRHSMADQFVIVNGWASYSYWKALEIQSYKQTAMIIRESPRHFLADDRSESLEALLCGFAEFDRLIFVSDRLREEWGCFEELAGKPAFYLPNCCEEEEILQIEQSNRQEMRRRLRLSRDDLVLICPGTIEKRKGQDIILDAWPAVLEAIPRARLLLLGDGGTAWGKAVAADVNNGKYGDRVFCVPAQPSALPYLHAADLLLFSSRAEAMPRTILEAMALGIPIVSTNVDGIPELIEDDVSGRLFPPADPSIMLEALQTVAASADAAERFTRAAKRTYEEKFSRKQQIERVRNMLTWLGTPDLCIRTRDLPKKVPL